MKIDRWISFDEADGMSEAVGGMGGVWDGMDRAEYLATWLPEARPYIEAIWSALDERGAMSGQEHQDSGVPVFDDGKVASFSMRGWGDLVAAWWNSAHPDEPRRSYCHYAWDLP